MLWIDRRGEVRDEYGTVVDRGHEAYEREYAPRYSTVHTARTGLGNVLKFYTCVIGLTWFVYRVAGLLR